MPVLHYSVFYRPDALPAAQPTMSNSTITLTKWKMASQMEVVMVVMTLVFLKNVYGCGHLAHKIPVPAIHKSCLPEYVKES